MQHPDEGVIHTWLDGELPAEEAAAIEAHIAECADCAAAVAEARGLIAASSRIVSALDIVPGDVIPASAPRKRAWYANTQLRAAAAVLVVAGASLVVMRRERAPEMARVMDQAASVSADAGAKATTPSAVEADSARPLMSAKSGTARR
ncbi:MAG: zf-HC2 domain-containing protein, partial [Gemmatimonadales bacterium]